MDKIQALEELKHDLTVALAKAICKNVSRDEVHRMVDQLYDEYMAGGVEE